MKDEKTRAVLQAKERTMETDGYCETIQIETEKISRLKLSQQKHFWSKARQYLVYRIINTFQTKCDALLDVGCGKGGLLHFLKTRMSACRLEGIDGSVDALDAARKVCPTATLYLQDIARTPWQKIATYDVITCMDVLEHLDDPAATLREMRRMMTDNGIVIVSVPARHELWSNRDVFIGHRKRYDKKSLTLLLKESGFDVLHVNYLFFCLYLPMLASRKLLAAGWKKPDGKLGTSERGIFPVINTCMTLLGCCEALLSLVCPLPIGTSVYCIARKNRGCA